MTFETEEERDNYVAAIMTHIVKLTSKLRDIDVHNFDVEYELGGQAYVLKFSKSEEVIIMDVKNDNT